ncbi:MAG: GH36 C-terminal domain-containing protein [Verrucomicrobia bacterium]|nr:GH36 C-terminal domain-containing protein [Verrucomicrobiota bacterium]
MKIRIILCCFAVLAAHGLAMSVQAAEPPKEDQPAHQPEVTVPATEPKLIVQGKKEVWTLSTGDTKATVGVDSLNQLVIYELISTATGWNWTRTPTVIPLPTRMEVQAATKTLDKGALPVLKVGDLIQATGGDKDIPWTGSAETVATPATGGNKKDEQPELSKQAIWKFHKGSTASSTNGTTVTLTFTCRQLPTLSLESVWWAASSSLPGPIQHTFRMINESTSDVTIHPIPNLAFAVHPPPGHDVTLRSFGDHETKKIETNHVGSMPEDLGQEAGAEKVQMEVVGKNGELGQCMPIVLLDDRSTSGLYLGMEEKKDFAFQITTRAVAPRFGLKASYRPQANLHLAGRNIITTRPTYLGVYQGDLDDGVNQFKRWFWNNKTPANHRNDPTAPWLQYGGMWTYGTSGAWKNAPMPWWNDEATYRKGIEKEGLAGIGFECAEVDAYWDKAEQAGELPSGTKIMGPLAHANGLKFNLYFGNSISWASRQQLLTAWQDYQLDMWRNDFQVAGLDVQAWAQDNCPKNYRFQFCAASPDFHTMTYASLTDLWEEYNVANIRQQFYTLSYTIPPAQICAMIPIQVASAGDKDRFNVWHRSTLLSGAWLGVGAIGPKYNPKNIVLPSDVPQVIPCMKSNLALYKSKIRPLVREGNLYHNIVEADSGFDGAQYYSPLEDRGLVLLFGPAGKSTTVRCKRLKPEQKYKVQFTDQPAQNTTITGAQLMTEGLSVTFTGTVQSEIILIEK